MIIRNRIKYYSDELNDDFSTAKIKTEKVGKDFRFVNDSLLWKVCSWILYYIIALPIIWIVAKIYLGVKIENRAVVKKIRKKCFFIYVNHTRMLDVFIPPLITFPSRIYIVANADAVSIKGLRRIVMLLGGLPIPSGFDAMPGFIKAVEKRANEKNCIVIFPEAHIWPFYTGIRPFPAVSFGFPAGMNFPVLSATVTYRRRRGFFRFAKKPGMTVYIGEPVFPDPELTKSVRKQKLRDEIYGQMCNSSEKNEVEYIKYVKE